MSGAVSVVQVLELSGGGDQQSMRARLTMLSRRAQGSPTRLFLLTPIDLGRGVVEPKSSILEVACGLREARGVLPCERRARRLGAPLPCARMACGSNSAVLPLSVAFEQFPLRNSCERLR